MTTQAQPTLMDLLDQYERDHQLMRRLVLPQEANRRLTQWCGGYRWFLSPNVICLEKIRLLRKAKAADQVGNC
jgi:hypothetical protein